MILPYSYADFFLDFMMTHQFFVYFFIIIVQPHSELDQVFGKFFLVRFEFIQLSSVYLAFKDLFTDEYHLLEHISDSIFHIRVRWKGNVVLSQLVQYQIEKIFEINVRVFLMVIEIDFLFEQEIGLLNWTEAKLAWKFIVP